MRILAGVLVALAVLVPLAAMAVRRRSADGRDVAAPAGRGLELADGLLALAVFVLVVLAIVVLRQ